MLAAEYQYPTRMLCDLPWSGWRGCYVIFHVKPLEFLPAFDPMIIVLAVFEPCYYFDDLVSSALLCWDDLVSSEIV